MSMRPTRRDVLAGSAALLMRSVAGAAEARRPNFVFIVADDFSPDLGCYGQKLARTPNLDRLASQGARYTHAFTHCAVCAPSRSGLITGRYPTSIGTHHMRSELIKPPPMFTDHLRKAGYHVAWPGKTDFNFVVDKDAFDSTADWTKGPPPKQPFFAYINLAATHEGQIRDQKLHTRNTASLSPEDRQDPAKMELPPYYPDTPEARRDYANYFEAVTMVDHRVGQVLDYADRNGLTDNTMVFFFGDHGRGLPRAKRWVYDSGIHVPLIARWPGRINAGSVRDELVSFVDFAPTVLSLAGVDVPKELDGQAFLSSDGSSGLRPRKYVFAHRDRMDETFDRIRAVRDHRFKYVRNFHPELPYAQPIQYMDVGNTMQAWRRLHAEGKLTGAQKLFFSESKSKEELYDVGSDPHEINNLAGSPMHQAKLEELRKALDQWISDSGDLGAIPEKELIRRGLVRDRLAEYEKRKQS